MFLLSNFLCAQIILCHFIFLQDGHLKMLGGYLEFFMKPALADTYLKLKRELDELIHDKVSGIHEHHKLEELNSYNFGKMLQG